MAEKEQRIYAYYYKKHPCDGCEAKEVYDGCNCPVLEEYEMSITRQEAIEKMAKAIFDYYTDRTEPQNWKLKEVRDNFNKVAEAALNALLGGKDA